MSSSPVTTTSTFLLLSTTFNQGLFVMYFTRACLLALLVTTVQCRADIIVGSTDEGFAGEIIANRVDDFSIGAGLLTRMTVIPGSNAVRFETRDPWNVRGDNSGFLSLGAAGVEIGTIGDVWNGVNGGVFGTAAIEINPGQGPGAISFSNQYAGFHDPDTDNAAWVELSYDTSSNVLTVHDYAYTTSGEGTTFLTGATSFTAAAVPEPSAFAILSVAGIGFGFCRRWRQQRRSSP